MFGVSTAFILRTSFKMYLNSFIDIKSKRVKESHVKHQNQAFIN